MDKDKITMKKTKPILGIDVSRLADKNPTGVELATNELLKSLVPKLRGKFSLRFYSPKKITSLSFKINQKEYRIVKSKRLWTFLHLAHELKNNPPDIFFSPSNFLPFFAPKNSITIIHDIAFKVFPKSYSTSRRLILGFGLRQAAKAKTVIVPSEATKKDLLKYTNIPKKKIVVIQFGFTAPKVDKKKVIKKNQILFLGRIENKKNLLNLIHAFRMFKKTNFEYKLILAGNDGYGSRSIKKLANKNAEIKFIGYCDKKKKEELFKESKIFAFPSLYEGFGFPILEAQSFSLPVLTSNISSCPEVGGEGAVYINPKKPKEIADVLHKLANNKKLRKQLIEKGKRNLERFSWNKVAQKFQRIFKQT